MELKDRLKAARKHAQLTQPQLAERVGMDQTSISNLERGKSAGSKFTAQIARVCGVSPIWLAEGRGEMLPAFAKAEYGKGAETRAIQADAEMIGMIDAWDEGDPLDDDDCEVPYYAEVEFAGGNGMSEVVEVADRKLRFSNATLRDAGVDRASAAVARVRGNSMERLIMDGAAIGFDMSDTSIIDGEIYAFNHGGLLRTKYLYRLPGGGVRIKSENEHDHPEETMSAEEWREQVKMLGRVFWWSTVRRSPRRR
ncbi:helix-turn-helix transcriptional regulator [Pseudomonas sp. D1-3]